MKKKFLFLFLFTVASLCPIELIHATQVSVSISTDNSFNNNDGIIEIMQQNLSKLLTEINAAFAENRALNMSGQMVNDYAKGNIVMIWEHAHFYCETEIKDRCWNLKNGYLLRRVPVILHIDNDGASIDKKQACSVEFNEEGVITSFWFVFDSHLSESMEDCGAIVENERKMQILKYCDRFRTAYCTKDIKFIEQVFSDDALIITGNVVTVKEFEKPYEKVVYNRQNKDQYIKNLKRAFERNKYIDVKFSEIDPTANESCNTVTRSPYNDKYYGVRLRQEWKSSNYNDVGYVFLLWDFTIETAPKIHVRTWQPEIVNGKKISDDEIFSCDDFEPKQ